MFAEQAMLAMPVNNKKFSPVPTIVQAEELAIRTQVISIT